MPLDLEPHLAIARCMPGGTWEVVYDARCTDTPEKRRYLREELALRLLHRHDNADADGDTELADRFRWASETVMNNDIAHVTVAGEHYAIVAVQRTIPEITLEEGS